MRAKSIRDMSAEELRALVESPDEPMKLRNRAAKRFKELRRQARDSSRFEVQSSKFRHPTPHD